MIVILCGLWWKASTFHFIVKSDNFHLILSFVKISVPKIFSQFSPSVYCKEIFSTKGTNWSFWIYTNSVTKLPILPSRLARGGYRSERMISSQNISMTFEIFDLCHFNGTHSNYYENCVGNDQNGVRSKHLATIYLTKRTSQTTDTRSIPISVSSLPRSRSASRLSQTRTAWRQMKKPQTHCCPVRLKQYGIALIPSAVNQDLHTQPAYNPFCVAFHRHHSHTPVLILNPPTSSPQENNPQG